MTWGLQEERPSGVVGGLDEFGVAGPPDGVHNSVPV
jgi:hypothetical protein